MSELKPGQDGYLETIEPFVATDPWWESEEYKRESAEQNIRDTSEQRKAEVAAEVEDFASEVEIDNEYTLIGSMIEAANCGDELPRSLYALEPSDFVDSICRDIFRAAQEIMAERYLPDLVTICEYMRKHKTGIKSSDVAMIATHYGITGANVFRWADVVLEQSKARKRRAQIQKAGETIIETDNDAERTDAANLVLRGVSDAREGTAATFDTLAVAEVQSVEGFGSGYRSLDRVLGEMKRGHLVVLAARPAVGKTAVALNIADKVSKAGRPVMYFSIEMSVGEIVDRLKNLRDLKSGGDFYLVDRPSLSLQDIRAELSKVPPVDFVVVDYLQLIKSGKRYDRRDLEVTDLAYGLKEMARQFDCVVLAVSQLNRAPEQRGDKRPVAADLRDSGGIEQAADSILLLYRDMEDENAQSVGSEKIEIRVAKNRSGRTGKVELEWIGNRCAILDS